MAIPLVGSAPQPKTELLVGDSSTFAGSAGNWVAVGSATVSRVVSPEPSLGDTGYSLKIVTTALNDGAEVAIPPCPVGYDYVAYITLKVDFPTSLANAATLPNIEFTFGDTGASDLTTTSYHPSPLVDRMWVNDDAAFTSFFHQLIRWRPGATRSAVKVRVRVISGGGSDYSGTIWVGSLRVIKVKRYDSTPFFHNAYDDDMRVAGEVTGIDFSGGGAIFGDPRGTLEMWNVGYNAGLGIYSQPESSATEWVTGHAYNLGDIVVPTTLTTHTYICTVSGTSGGTEPTWPVGGTVTDGGVTWTESGSISNGYIYLASEHPPRSLAYDGGVVIDVGDDYVGIQMSEKDADTVQLYADAAGGYDIELRDRGTDKGWKAADSDGQETGLLSRSPFRHFSAAPTSPTPVEGDCYYDTTTHKLRVHNGSGWQDCW
jgi:hypothetical protein